jgi:hypothetical protein
MTVYVDNGRWPYQGMLMSRMMADTLDELHAMADTIGVARRWYQSNAFVPHYDICQTKRAKALQAGAQPIDRQGIVEVARQSRREYGIDDDERERIDMKMNKISEQRIILDGLLYGGPSDLWGGYDFSKQSRAVVAARSKDEGIVLWGVGGHINAAMHPAASSLGPTLDALDLTAPGCGIWIWEGKYVWAPENLEHPDSDDSMPQGEWREPTEEEWQSIRNGVCPWDDEDWLLSKCCKELGGSRCNRPEGHAGGHIYPEALKAGIWG